VAAAGIDNGIWLVGFMDYDLRYIDLEEKLEVGENARHHGRLFVPWRAEVGTNHIQAREAPQHRVQADGSHPSRGKFYRCLLRAITR
jgi:hypothetical protein